MGQVNFGKPPAGGIVEQEIVGGLGPDGSEFHAAGTVQHELDTAAASGLLQFEFGHWKVEFKQVFAAAELQVDELTKLFPCANICRRLWRCRCGR